MHVWRRRQVPPRDHRGALAVALLIVAIHENLSDVKPREITNRYTVLFQEILPTLKVHRNIIAQDIKWNEIWDLLENLTEIKQKVKAAMQDLRVWSRKIFDNSSESFICASDSSFADNTVNRKSSQGYIMILFGGAIGWRANKQDTVTTSSTETELLALSQNAIGAK
jgi:hypothetical protein